MSCYRIRHQPLPLRFPKVAQDLSGRDIDILLDISIILHSNTAVLSNLYPLVLAIYTKSLSFTSDMYNADTNVIGHPSNPSSNNSYPSYHTVTFRMQYSDTKETVPEYLLSAVDDMDTKRRNCAVYLWIRSRSVCERSKLPNILRYLGEQNVMEGKADRQNDTIFPR